MKIVVDESGTPVLQKHQITTVNFPENFNPYLTLQIPTWLESSLYLPSCPSGDDEQSDGDAQAMVISLLWMTLGMEEE